MLVEEQPIGHAHLPEGLGARDLWADAGPPAPLRRLSHPVVPVGARPLAAQLRPQIAPYHPAQPGEEIRAVEALRCALFNEPLLAVVVPGADAPEAGVGGEKGEGGAEIFEEVRRHLQVVFYDDDLVVVEGVEYLVQRPAVMPKMYGSKVNN